MTIRRPLVLISGDIHQLPVGDTIEGGGGDALTTNPLSQFAATTSSQLLGVISDETGSGALVFATSPTLVTPVLGTPTSGTLDNCTSNTETAGNNSTQLATTAYADRLTAGTLAGAFTTLSATGLSTLSGGATISGPAAISSARSAWAGIVTGVDVANGALASTTANLSDISLISNAYYNGTAYVYKGSGYSGRFRLLNGNVSLLCAPTGVADAAITYTEIAAISLAGLAVTGTLSVSGATTVGGGATLRAQTSAAASWAGYGVEIFASGTTSYVTAYNRTTPDYSALSIIASTLEVSCNTAITGALSATSYGTFYTDAGGNGGIRIRARASDDAVSNLLFYNNAGAVIYSQVHATSSSEIKTYAGATLVTTTSSTGLAVTGAISATTTIKTGGYTVGTLPAPATGMRTYVTDASAPTFGATVAGGGAVVIPVFYNGSNWIVA